MAKTAISQAPPSAPAPARRVQSRAARTKARVEQIALALMGSGELPAAWLAENAVWDRGGGAVAGRAAIEAARQGVARADRIMVEQVVTHGAAGSVSGRVWRDGAPPRLFCHVIRFTSGAADQIAQLVSFEHPGGND